MGVGRRTARHEHLVGVWDEKADNGEGDDVEQRDTPEDLLDSRWKGLARVLRFSGSQTDQLGTSEGESSIDEDTAEALETVVEGAGVVPELCTDVSALRATTTIQDDTEDAISECQHAALYCQSMPEDSHETNDRSDLDDGEHEFRLTVAFDTKHVDGNDHNPENAHPRGIGDVWVPVTDRD